MAIFNNGLAEREDAADFLNVTYPTNTLVTSTTSLLSR